ncbi:MAG: PIN domain-containing protein [Euryarchaeota archaeon]|nr:PIN domain-containing protein [Euryarchaeota archaeon]
MVLADTSFLVALQDEDSQSHEAAVHHPALRDGIQIPAEIWLEYCYLLARSTTKARTELLSHLLSGPFHVRKGLDPEDIAALAARSVDVQRRIQAAGKKPLSFFDLLLCLIAQRLGESVLTFDGAMVDAVRAKFFPGARIA